MVGGRCDNYRWQLKLKRRDLATVWWNKYLVILVRPRGQTKRVPDVHLALVVAEQVEFRPVTGMAIGVIVPLPGHFYVLWLVP